MLRTDSLDLRAPALDRSRLKHTERLPNAWRGDLIIRDLPFAHLGPLWVLMLRSIYAIRGFTCSCTALIYATVGFPRQTCNMYMEASLPHETTLISNTVHENDSSVNTNQLPLLIDIATDEEFVSLGNR